MLVHAECWASGGWFVKVSCVRGMFLSFLGLTSLCRKAQNAALSTLASLLNQLSLPLSTVKPTLNQRWLQRCTALATPVFSIFFPILCAVTSVAEIRPLFIPLKARSSKDLAV
ncbi:hypothetical protein DPMN_150636 [Dreissena polymorpha]|uniref:Uncharacterized protein n=1 Tax=Dreissena polymorpha TaxID=45954 RepID=A0A9D4J285_DREPO|nr:hypothetical protein DPMN_150636 [Dreissena polymorpha]